MINKTIRTGPHFTASMITDLRSAKAIIKILKQHDPALTNVEVSPAVYAKVRQEFTEELTKQARVTDYFTSDVLCGFANYTIYGVKLRIKG